MKHQKSVGLLVILIALFSLLAGGIGILSNGGAGSHIFTSIHGESVHIYGYGIYQNDSIATSAQAMAQDWVTVFLGVPLLIISFIIAGKGSIRAKLLLAGTLAYFLYTYMSYTFLCMYNPLFLIYVALMSMSLFAFVLTFISFDLTALAETFKCKFPVKPIGIFLIVFASLIGLMWIGGIIPPLMAGKVPTGLEHYTTLVIQAMDLGLVIPATILAAVLLLKRNPFGILLSAVMCMKGLTMLTALTAMVIGQMATGVKMSVIEVLLFPIMNIVVIFGVIVFMKRIPEPEKAAKNMTK